MASSSLCTYNRPASMHNAHLAGWLSWTMHKLQQQQQHGTHESENGINVAEMASVSLTRTKEIKGHKDRVRLVMRVLASRVHFQRERWGDPFQPHACCLVPGELRLNERNIENCERQILRCTCPVEAISAN